MDFIITLENQRIHSLKELGEKMYLYEDAAEKLVTSEKFLRFLKEYDREKYNRLVELNHRTREYEEFIFLAQYIFNPLMNLRHHGYRFDTFKELGMQILRFGPDIDIYLKDFLKYRLLSQYMEMLGFDASDPTLYAKIKELERLYFENENRAYFLLGFTLSESKSIVYRNRIYDDIGLFFQDMMRPSNLVSYSALIEQNQYVLSWLIYLGRQKEVDRFESLLNSIEMLEENYERRRKIPEVAE